MRTAFVVSIACVVNVFVIAGSVHAQGYSGLILSGNPLLYWNFNEAGDADPAIDQVGTDAGDNLAPEGNATRVASTSTTGGLALGRAASFDGLQATRFFSNMLTPATDPDAWALEMWIRPQGADPGIRNDYLLEARGPGGNNAPGILLDYVGGADDKVEVFRAGQRTGSAGPTLTTDVWQHLVIGYFGGANDRIDFFLNGAAAGSVTGFAADAPFGTDIIAVGNSVPTDPNFDAFQGQIDELALYDLTGQSINDVSGKLTALASHFAAGQPGIPGDANKDGVVNVLDFNLISTNLFTTQTAGNGGDLDFNAIVNFADFRIWKNAAPAELAGLFVPEPSFAPLLFLGAFWACRHGRRAA
jgi:hypothetical protein